MAYTIRSRFSLASSPVFMGGDRAAPNARARGAALGGTPSDIPDQSRGNPNPIVEPPGPGGGNNQQPQNGATVPVNAPTGSGIALTPQQVQQISQNPILAPLIEQFAAAEAAGTVRLVNDVAPTDIGITPAQNSNTSQLDPGFVEPVSRVNDVAPADTGVYTPPPEQPAPTAQLDPGLTDYATPVDSAIDPSLYAPPLDAIDYTNSNLTAY